MNIAGSLKWNHASGSKSLTRIVALGLGGAGIDFITHIMDADLNVHCVAGDTDPYHLQIAKAHTKLSIKRDLEIASKGNASSDTDLFRQVSNELKPLLRETDVVFVLAGMGGETGGVVAPSVAETARRMGALTIGLVTQPFHFERARFRPAIDNMRQMLNACDTTILLDNRPLDSSTATLPLKFAIDSPAQTTCAIIESISHTFANSALSNADLGEFQTMLRRGGLARVGVGHSYSHLGAEEAALKALRNTMALGELSHANGIFMNVAGSNRVEHRHLIFALDFLSRKINPNAQLLYGHRIDPSMMGITSVTLLATGLSFPFTWGGYRSLPLEIYELEPESPAEQKLGLHLELPQLESYVY